MKKLKFIMILFVFATLISCENNSKHKNKDGQDHSGHDHSEEDHSDDDHTEGEHNDELIEISKKQFAENNMLLGNISMRNFPKIVRTTGIIDVPPKSIETVSSFYEGFIKNSNLLVGDKVKKGQALVTIENPDFIDLQQEYLEIKEQIDYLKTEYERQKTLFNEQISSQKNYQKAESEYKGKLAQLKGLRKKIELLNININNVEQGNLTSVITLYSSINGSITAVNVNKGTHIDKTDVIMEIINTDHIHIELIVFEKDAMKIKKEQKIKFQIPEISDDYFEAEVHLVGKSIDKKSRTVVVHGHLHSETKNTFNIGMFVDATIEIENKNVKALPEDAVVEEGEHFIILKLVKEEKDYFVFEQIEIENGTTYANFREIKADKLNVKDRFLIKGAFDLVGAGEAHEH